MSELESIRIFVNVVQRGSFSRAAEALRLPKSSVSRTIARLEDESGAKLLMRTTRSLATTPAGRALFDASVESIRSLEDALRSVRGKDGALAGRMKITAPEDMGGHAISPLVALLSREYPDLQFELVYTDEIVDLVRDGYDLAIRLGKLPPTRFRSIALGSIEVVPTASPRYLASRKRPRRPADLLEHDCLVYRPEAVHPKWTMRSTAGEVVQISVRPKIVANQMTSLLSLARAGAGIAFIPKYLCHSEIATGSLVRVLPDWSEPGLPVHCVSPLGSGSSSRLKVVTDRLAAGIRKALK